jgi:hypothetical protein
VSVWSEQRGRKAREERGKEQLSESPTLSHPISSYEIMGIEEESEGALERTEGRTLDEL